MFFSAGKFFCSLSPCFISCVANLQKGYSCGSPSRLLFLLFVDLLGLLLRKATVCILVVPGGSGGSTPIQKVNVEKWIPTKCQMPTNRCQNTDGIFRSSICYRMHSYYYVSKRQVMTSLLIVSKHPKAIWHGLIHELAMVHFLHPKYLPQAGFCAEAICYLWEVWVRKIVEKGGINSFHMTSWMSWEQCEVNMSVLRSQPALEKWQVREDFSWIAIQGKEFYWGESKPITTHFCSHPTCMSVWDSFWGVQLIFDNKGKRTMHPNLLISQERMTHHNGTRQGCLLLLLAAHNVE